MHARANDPTAALARSCANIYVGHIYFEVPVLDYVGLLNCLHGDGPPYPFDTLLHHALVAAATPWLNIELLPRHGFQSREEIFSSSLERFEVSKQGKGAQSCC